MQSKIIGKTHKFGDNIDTDIIIPARYLPLPISEAKMFTMEPIRQNFPKKIKKGDIIVGGSNFGCGSSREQAPLVLKELGVSAIIAASFARIFFRNAINLGIPVIECSNIQQNVNDNDIVDIDLNSGLIICNGRSFNGSKIPAFLMEIIEAGGLIPSMLKKN